MTEYKTRADVDLEQLSEDLREVADEIANAETPLTGLESKTKVGMDDTNKIDISIELVDVDGSIVSGGYTIPYDD